MVFSFAVLAFLGFFLGLQLLILQFSTFFLSGISVLGTPQREGWGAVNIKSVAMCCYVRPRKFETYPKHGRQYCRKGTLFLHFS